MWDLELEQHARRLLDEASELKAEGFRGFAALASRVFPPYFETFGILPEEAESLTVRAVKRIAADLRGYGQDGRARLKEWLSDHLNAVMGEWLKELRRASREIEAAGERQQQMLRLIEVPGAELAARYRAARLVSGDFFDAISCADGSYLIAVGDASGKGGAAAFYSLLALGMLRAKAAVATDLPDLMRQMNAGLTGGATNSYLTLILAKWYPTERRIVLAGAGACSPVRVTADGAEEIRLSGEWLGTFADVQPETSEFYPAAGEILALSSDGLPDQARDDEYTDQYGADRLGSALRAAFHMPVAEAINSVFENLDQYREGTVLTDDQTLVVVKFL